MLNISYTISVKEIKDAIQKLPISKIPGPDKIPNKAIKTAAEELAALFANIATACFQKGKLPKCLKTTTTVILQKLKKKDYSLLRNYQPIALKNTLEKLLKNSYKINTRNSKGI